jgi:hypothetical protein
MGFLDPMPARILKKAPARFVGAVGHVDEKFVRNAGVLASSVNDYITVLYAIWSKWAANKVDDWSDDARSFTQRAGDAALSRLSPPLRNAAVAFATDHWTIIDALMFPSEELADGSFRRELAGGCVAQFSAQCGTDPDEPVIFLKVGASGFPGAQRAFLNSILGGEDNHRRAVAVDEDSTRPGIVRVQVECWDQGDGKGEVRRAFFFNQLVPNL